MNRVADYLSRAIETEKKAAKAKGALKAELMAVADQWRDLARQAVLLAEFEEQTSRDGGSDPA